MERVGLRMRFHGTEEPHTIRHDAENAVARETLEMTAGSVRLSTGKIPWKPMGDPGSDHASKAAIAAPLVPRRVLRAFHMSSHLQHQRFAKRSAQDPLLQLH
jgi:hypothetical protein